jgi:hypothetical protein
LAERLGVRDVGPAKAMVARPPWVRNDRRENREGELMLSADFSEKAELSLIYIFDPEDR